MIRTDSLPAPHQLRSLPSERARSPADDAQLVLADGRSLCYRIYGARHGRPLFFLHGFPGCRIQAELIATRAAASNVRLIAFDRPGFGRSSPAPARTITGLVDDVRQLADHLGHRQFGVLGISCGGPYALACAHGIPDRIHYTGIVAGAGPMDLKVLRTGQLRYLRLLFALARIRPALAAPLLLPDRLLFRSNAQRAARVLSRMLTKPDRVLLHEEPAVLDAFGASLAEAYRQGLKGALVEASLIARPRDFEMRDIHVPVHVYQSGDDRHVPPVMGLYQAGNIPRSVLHLYPKEGHLSIVVNKAADFLRDFDASFPKPG